MQAINLNEINQDVQSSIFAFVTQKESVWSQMFHGNTTIIEKKRVNTLTQCVFITENVKKQSEKNATQQKSRDNQTPPLHYFLSRTVVVPKVQRIKPNKWQQICFYSLACSIRQEENDHPRWKYWKSCGETESERGDQRWDHFWILIVKKKLLL